MRAQSLVVRMLAIGFMPLALVSCKEIKGGDMQLTILVKSPLLEDGGTIVFLPKTVPPSDKCSKPLEVEVSDDFSFVQFDYCGPEAWSVKFEPGTSEIGRPASTRFKMLTIGSGEYDNEQGQRIEVEQYQVFHVSGKRFSENDSYARGVHYYEYLAKGVNCQNFGDRAKVCVPKQKTI